MSNRKVRVRRYTWNEGSPSERTGILLRAAAGAALLTPQEALTVADQLVDAAERMLVEQPEASHAPEA